MSAKEDKAKRKQARDLERAKEKLDKSPFGPIKIAMIFFT